MAERSLHTPSGHETDATLDTPHKDIHVEKGDVEKQPEDPAEGQPAPRWGSDAPDGGVKAWLCVLGAWCTAVCSFGWINSIGNFQQYYQTGPLSNYSSSTISWIPSLQIFFMMATGPIVGKLYDKHGPRYLILVGSFLHVFGLMMASLADKYYQFLLSQGVCSAIGVAMIFQPAVNSISQWFNLKRGIAYGLMSTGSSLGGVIFPIMVGRLIKSVGYGWAMRTSAFLILAFLIVANLTVRSRLPPHPTQVTKEQLVKPFKEPGFLGLLAGMFFLTFGIYVPITYIAVQAVAQGMDPDLAQYLVAMLNAGSLFGRLAAGFGADKIGKYNAFVICCYITGVTVLALWIPISNDAGNIAFSVIFGTFSGAYVSLIAGLAAEISPGPEIGFRTGLVFLISSLPGLTTDPIAGAILTNTGSWVGLKVFSGVMILTGTTFILFTRVHKAGWKLTSVF